VLPAPSARAIAGRRFNASLTLVLDVAIECQAPPGTLAAEQDGTRQYTPCERRADRLLGQADLLHEILVVPKQPFMVHHTVFPPVADRGHPDGESFTRWATVLPSPVGIGLVKVPVMTPVTAVEGGATGRQQGKSG
jgi:hypothetical protein